MSTSGDPQRLEIQKKKKKLLLRHSEERESALILSWEFRKLREALRRDAGGEEKRASGSSSELKSYW